MILFSDDNILVSSNVTQLVTVKIHQKFAQAALGGSEVDFHFGLRPGFNAAIESGGNKYLHVTLTCTASIHLILLDYCFSSVNGLTSATKVLVRFFNH